MFACRAQHAVLPAAPHDDHAVRVDVKPAPRLADVVRADEIALLARELLARVLRHVATLAPAGRAGLGGEALANTSGKIANGLEPGAGPGLIFVTLPIAFGQMPLGQVVGVFFFVMLLIAALTSAISLSEPTIAWLTERFRVSRLKAVLLSGAALWLLSLGSVFSFNLWAEGTLFGKTFFDCLDYLTTNLLMPLGGLATVFFTGWVLKRKRVSEALNIGHPMLFQAWWWLIRFVTPLGIVLVFLNLIGVI